MVCFADQFQHVIDRYDNCTMIIESLFTAKNVRSILQLSHIRGVAMMMAARRGWNVIEIPPATVKQNITGYGRATKEQIQFMVQRLLRLPELPKPNDCADALAMAICYLNQARFDRRIRKSR